MVYRVCTRGDSEYRTSLIVHPAAESNDVPHVLESRTMTLSGGVDGLPDKITCKQIYQVEGHSQEGPLFSQFNGQFGIADVIGYHNCGPEEPHGSTGRLLNGAEFWNIFDRQDLARFPGGRPQPKGRGLQCIALSGDGKALIDLDVTDGGTPSPYELLESILHAIIGKSFDHPLRFTLHSRLPI